MTGGRLTNRRTNPVPDKAPIPEGRMSDYLMSRQTRHQIAPPLIRETDRS
jgi:hypothetical protein